MKHLPTRHVRFCGFIVLAAVVSIGRAGELDSLLDEYRAQSNRAFDAAQRSMSRLLIVAESEGMVGLLTPDGGG